MGEQLTLAQISDVHLAPITGFGLRYWPRYWNVKRALGGLNWLRGRRSVHQRRIADMIAADAVAQHPDHIAVTGDIANLGLPAEYAAAAKWLEQLGPPERVTVIPGNHDIYTRRMHGASCLVDWAAYMTSQSWEIGVAPASAAAAFPFVRRIGHVALIGMNSAVPTPPFVASGRLGAEQLAAIGPILDATRAAGLVRVVLIHHPPLPGQAKARRGLVDAAELERLLAEHGAELVLHGHNHRDMLAWCPSVTGDIPVLGIASASAAISHGREPRARYNLLTLTRNAGRARISYVTRGLNDSGDAIVELARRDLSTTQNQG